jgi:carbonic anhydrase/acetyltransferase-like protein (isoleucine patch superfamily)
MTRGNREQQINGRYQRFILSYSVHKADALAQVIIHRSSKISDGCAVRTAHRGEAQTVWHRKIRKVIFEFWS